MSVLEESTNLCNYHNGRTSLQIQEHRCAVRSFKTAYVNEQIVAALHAAFEKSLADQTHQTSWSVYVQISTQTFTPSGVQVPRVNL